MPAQPIPADPVDQIMDVMARAFDPAFGEAWNRRQVSDALLLGNCRYGIVGFDGAPCAAGTEPAGFFLSRTAFDEEELLLIAVDPRFRRKGLGAALLAQFMEEAAARGSRSLFLEMRSNNPAAALYEAHGFRPVGKRPSYYRLADGGKLDAISYRRDVD
ncbi:GNAT family N-acetyltransferase [Novosphingobium tardum]|uniref:GNAT family N-acetyltransferase n=1 Tax=Novosphingobium tardum TaxID=1538021 RepID=A0ABV8RT74_9SPHN